ncbi:ferredoxin--NADP reductase, partial [Patescibacteria group bacterium]
MAKPSIIKAKVTDKKLLNHKILHFEFTSKDNIDFTPGQYLSIKVDEYSYRAYSICKLLGKTFSIIASVEHEGLGSNYLKKLKVGDSIFGVGPRGKFNLKTTLSNNLVFISTGTGIAPHISFIDELINLKYKGNIEIIAGFRDECEIIFEKMLDNYKEKLNMEINYCLSKATKSNYYLGRVT